MTVIAACHAVGVGARRSVRLRVIGGSVELRDDVPQSRADCVDGPRPCPHVKCRYHLWLIEGHDRPGQFPAEATLRTVWLEWPLPPTCALDIADRAPNVEQAARAIGLRPSHFREILARAREKLRKNGDSLRDETGDESGDRDKVKAP